VCLYLAFDSANMANFNFNPLRIQNSKEFNEAAIELFRHQAEHCEVYATYLGYLNCNPSKIQVVSEIPCLPLAAFKSHEVKTGAFLTEQLFTSSGTTGSMTSSHHVKHLSEYESVFQKGFKQFYGKPQDYCILALLPAYLERKGSSLVYMAEKLITTSQHPLSGFYLNELEELTKVLAELKAKKQPTILLGVTFALLDLAEMAPAPFEELIVMETGGMKGRRKEMVREEVHAILNRSFGTQKIHSEYGMTELMSQAYSKGDGLFDAPPWMRIFIRQVDDPFEMAEVGKTGGVNIIDLANEDSCAFLSTSDLGRVHHNGSFEIVGRFDHSDARGCNLLLA